MKYVILAGVILLGAKSIAFAQENLVPNGSFEQIDAVPMGVSQFYLARPWTSSANGPEPADLFHKKTRSQDVGVPQNYTGKQEPHTGDAYAGIAILRKGKHDYREFIQAPLTQPLIKGESYAVEFYASLSDYSELASNSLGMYISRKAPLLKENGFLMVKPQVMKPEEEIITETNGWVKVSGTIVAQGGETMLTIGNFMDQDDTPKKKVTSARKETDKEAFAYYYIDDVKITKVGEVPVAKKSEYFGDVKAEKPITLNNIFFRTDEAVLLPESYDELNKLYDFLSQNPTVSIRINGHTDITSNPEYNQTLSDNRAKAVKTYLIRKGINDNRIQTKGFGDTQPKASNDTEEGRQKNRRVEFEVLK